VNNSPVDVAEEEPAAKKPDISLRTLKNGAERVLEYYALAVAINSTPKEC